MKKAMLFKAFRKANHITQEDMADFLGVKRAFISQIENGYVDLPEDRLFQILNNDKGWDVTLLQESPVVNGDGNNVNNGRDQVVSPDSGLLAALREAQSQTSKSQEQIDRLLGIIETFTKPASK